MQITTQSGRSVQITRKGCDVTAAVAGVGTFRVRLDGDDLVTFVGPAVCIKPTAEHLPALKAMFADIAAVINAACAADQAYEDRHQRILRAMAGRVAVR